MISITRRLVLVFFFISPSRTELLKANFNDFCSFFSDLRTAFDLLDRDQDGMINNQELQFMLRNLGIELSDELIDGLMKEASKTGEHLFAMRFVKAFRAHSSRAKLLLSKHISCHSLTQFKSHHVVQWFLWPALPPRFSWLSTADGAFWVREFSFATVLLYWLSIWKQKLCNLRWWQSRDFRREIKIVLIKSRQVRCLKVTPGRIFGENNSVSRKALAKKSLLKT